MTLAIVHSRAQCGIRAPSVSVEVHLANGLPALNIEGPYHLKPNGGMMYEPSTQDESRAVPIERDICL